MRAAVDWRSVVLPRFKELHPLLWPVIVYDVLVADGSGSDLNLAQEAVLELVRLGVRDSREMSHLLHLDPGLIDIVVDAGVRFVTTSAGDPNRFTARLKDAGLTVFHVVPTLHAAHKAVEAGVDGLIVEGGEGGGFKNPRPVASMVLLPLIVSQIDLPVIAAGGFVDGPTMAAALALGAEGMQLGTRMVSAAESPVHDHWKQAILDAAETDTVVLNRHTSPALRALRTATTDGYEFDGERNAMGELLNANALYFGGDMEASIALTGQVAGRIESVAPVRDIIHGTVREFRSRVAALSALL